MIAIAGIPRSGKTTYALSIDPHARSTDKVKLDWSEASTEVATWFDNSAIQVVEGVVVPRALRKWLRANKKDLFKKPVDELVFLPHPLLVLSDGQERMAKGCWTVFYEILPALVTRGVEVRICSAKQKR